MKKQDNTMHADIGGRLKYHRTRLDFTVEQLAESVELTPRYIQEVERGKVGMSLTTLKKLCAALSVSADALLFGEPAGVDALMRGLDRHAIEQIEELVRLQLKIMQK